MSAKSFFQNTKQIMHFSHASFRSICCIPAQFLQGLILWQMSCSWPRRPAKEGGEARASCYHAVTMLLPCHATSHSPDRWSVAHVGGASPPTIPGWRRVGWNLCLLVVAPFLIDLGTEEKREGCIFWHLVSSLTHRGHIGRGGHVLLWWLSATTSGGLVTFFLLTVITRTENRSFN